MEYGQSRSAVKLLRASASLNYTIILFYFVGFVLLMLKPDPNFKLQHIIIIPVITLLLHINLNILPKRLVIDRLLVAIVNFLCALGVLILYSTNKDRGITQLVYYMLGTVFMIICIYAVRNLNNWESLALILIPVSLVFMLSPIIFGKEINGAKNWIYFSGISVQPSEITKICLVIIAAYSMSRYRKLYWMVFLLFSMGILMLQKDLGALLLYFLTCLMMYYASNGSLRIIFASIGIGFATSVFGYFHFAHVKKRIAIWQNPWVDYENTGYQLVQSLVAIASGGLWGVGLGLGKPSAIPIYFTDFIFAVICEQFGIIFGALVLFMYIILILRGGFIAKSANTRFYSLLALGCTIMLSLQTFIIIGGVIKLIPLTGVTMPFVSYGGSSLISCMGLIGILQGVSIHNKDNMRDEANLALQDSMLNGGMQ